ncbi:Uma2 family endonuclease [uncultured Thiocystis sp.]|jgi:Uma2 family endonuclease|uniref:Uma2 family endonuclease n=1 Tax=uncultured Thiocystis sp. TaxID=1202134 RepID=UPI0025DCA92F|nr:Uma2 family endonuclease [uncultured Thiocystis sp.]
MSSVLSSRATAPSPSRHRWSVADYRRMAQSGLLDATDRVELIEGELIDMAPIGCKHAFLVDRLAELLGGGPCANYMVRVQNPVALDTRSEPQPDIALVNRDNYSDRHPGPSDIRLIVEVSDTTLLYDRDVKLPLYARVGIPEVWLLDAQSGELTVHREFAEGQYSLIRKPTMNETLSPILLPKVTIRLAEMLD